jgi:type I restriction enzyme S subunit
MAEVPAGLDVSPVHWAIVEAIVKKHVADREVWAFGSRTKHSAKPYSDLDLVVMGEQPLSLATSAALADDFSESDLPWRVDVVDWATTSEEFRKVIAVHRVPVHLPKA